MAFCKNCGQSLPEGATFCNNCGTPTEDVSKQSQTADRQNGTVQNGVFNTPDQSAEFAPFDIQSNKVMAVLSYIGLLVLIPIFLAKDSKFAKFHASQGLNLALLEVAYTIVYNIICLIVRAAFFNTYSLSAWGTGMIVSTILTVINVLVCLVFLGGTVFGIVNACQGQARKIPLIGGIDILGKFMK